MSEGLLVFIDALRHRRRFCPVRLHIPAMDVEAAGLMKGGTPHLRRRADGMFIPCQVRSTGDGIEVAWVVEELGAAEKDFYELIPASPVPGASEEGAISGVKVLQGDAGELKVYVGASYFFSYHYGQDVAKPYIGPVVGPYGDWVTRLDLTIKEHPHQRSIWVAIGDVNGVDVWNEPPGSHGKQVHKGFREVIEGPVFGRIVADNTWTDFEGRELVDETRTLTIYNTPARERIFDIEIVFRANYGKVIFGPTKEAGPLGIRVAESMKGQNGGRIENSYGAFTEKETWGKRAQWCDYSGPVNGHHVGIAVFDHMENERHPTFWHVRDYGLMAPNNFYFSGARELEPSESLRFCYRIYIHTGDAASAHVADKYHDFINPPEVKIAMP